jgi:hypothetical protein
MGAMNHRPLKLMRALPASIQDSVFRNQNGSSFCSAKAVELKDTQADYASQILVFY